MQREVGKLWIHSRIPYLLAYLLVVLGLLQALLGVSLSLSSDHLDGNTGFVENPVTESLTTSKNGKLDKTKI